MKTRQHKNDLIKFYINSLENSTNIVFYQYGNLNQDELTSIRDNIPEDVQLVALKNKVFQAAIHNTRYQKLADVACGPTIMVFSTKDGKFKEILEQLMKDRRFIPMGLRMGSNIYYPHVIQQLTSKKNSGQIDLLNLLQQSISINMLERLNQNFIKILHSKYANDKSIN